MAESHDATVTLAGNFWRNHHTTGRGSSRTISSPFYGGQDQALEVGVFVPAARPFWKVPACPSPADLFSLVLQDLPLLLLSPSRPEPGGQPASSRCVGESVSFSGAPPQGRNYPTPVPRPPPPAGKSELPWRFGWWPATAWVSGGLLGSGGLMWTRIGP